VRDFRVRVGAGRWADAGYASSAAIGRLLPYLRNQRTRHGSGLLEPDFEQNEATLADNEVVVDTW